MAYKFATGSIYRGDIYHENDAEKNTYLDWSDNAFGVVVGGVANLVLSSSTVILNDGAADVDLIVKSPNESKALYLHSGNEVLHINHGESSFKTKIHSTNGEAITVNNSGVILNEDGAAANDFRVETDNNTHMFFVDAGNDRIGIGTDSPDTTLHVEGTNDGSMWEAVRITNTGGTTGDDSAIYFTHYTDDRLQAFIKDDIGGSWDCKLHFGTTDSANNAATKMTLDGDGQLGIGTETPNSTFQVSGSQAGNYTQAAGNFTFDETHYIVDYTGDGDATFTLPDVSGITGRVYHIISHNQSEEDVNLTVTGSGGQFQSPSFESGDQDSIRIGGNTPQSITVVSTGGNWFVLNDNRAQEH